MTRMLDRFMPHYAFADRHAIAVNASPERTYDALKEAPAGEMPLVRLLFGLRSVPARLTGHGGLPSTADASLYQQLVAAMFTVLADEPGGGVVVGAIDQAWRLDGGEVVPIRDGGHFTQFEEPGFVKLAMGFEFERRGKGTHLITETRVQPTDPRSQRRFSCYWAVVRPGSGLVRRSWLSAVRQRAESM